MGWGLAIGGMAIGAVASSYLARGTSQTPGCLLFIVGAVGAAAHCFLCLFPLFYMAVQGFPYFTRVLPLLSVLSFPWLLKPLGSGGVGGQYC